MKTTIIHTDYASNRKVLVHALSELLNAKPHYCGAPTFAYDFGICRVLRDASIETAPSLRIDAVSRLVDALRENGFTCEIEERDDGESPANVADKNADESADESISEIAEGDPQTDAGLVISLPLDGFDAQSLDRLHALIASKRSLLTKALGVELLPLQVRENRVDFPWFHSEIDADHVQAYTTLIAKLCAMAKNSKRITATDKPTDNEKYAFRCFLLRLGFIGDEYKTARKILLRNLEGNGAFASGSDPRKSEHNSTEPEMTPETAVEQSADALESR